MTKFIDGPAAGVELPLRRAPLFLRVVQNSAGQWDALDQISDRPEPGETIHVYVKIRNHGMVHIDGRDKQGKRFGLWLASADYRYFNQQPDDETARDRQAWANWCMALWNKARQKKQEEQAIEE